MIMLLKVLSDCVMSVLGIIFENCSSVSLVKPCQSALLKLVNVLR